MRNLTCPVNDFQPHVKRDFHCSAAVTSQGILMTFWFMIFADSLWCYAGTPQTPVRGDKFLPVCCQHLLTTPKAQVREKSYVSCKPINTQQTDCSLSELKWAARCVLSKQLNFRQLNILGNVWKLNCEGEQRAVVRMKQCGGTQKALSYPEALEQ